MACLQKRCLMKAATSDEAIMGAITGFGAGAGMGVGSNVMAEGPKAALKGVGKAHAWNKDRKETNVQVEAGKYSTDEDVEFIRTNLEVGNAASEKHIANAENTKKALDEVESFSDMENSSNQTVKDYASKMREQETKEVSLGSKEHKDSINEGIHTILKAAKDPSVVANSLKQKYGIDVDGKSVQEIRKQLDAVSVQDIETMSKANALFSIESAAENNTNSRLENRVEGFKNNLSTHSSNIIDVGTKEVSNLKKKLDNFNKGVESRGKTKNSTIDVGSVSKKAPSSRLGILSSILGMNSDSNSMHDELNSYSLKSLEVAKSDIENKLKSMTPKSKEASKYEQTLSGIKDVISKRERSKERLNLRLLMKRY